nr:ap3-complex subunit beta-a [Quercus suber]
MGYSSLGETIPRTLSTVLKYLAWHFTSEALETKLQILNSIVKVLLFAEGQDIQSFKRVLNYVLELAECDLNYYIAPSIRDLHGLLHLIFSYVDILRSSFQTER